MPTPNTLLLRVFPVCLPTDVAPLNDADFVGRLDVRGGLPPLRDVLVVLLVDGVVLHLAVDGVQQEPFPSAEVPPSQLAVADDQFLVEPVLHELGELVVLFLDGCAELFHFPLALYAVCALAPGHELVPAHVVPSPVVAAPLASSSAPLSFVAP